MPDYNRGVADYAPVFSRRFVVAIALVALVLIATLIASLGPAALPESAPLGDFSAGRARMVLERLAGDGIAHPIGSPQHAVVRDRGASRSFARSVTRP